MLLKHLCPSREHIGSPPSSPVFLRARPLCQHSETMCDGVDGFLLTSRTMTCCRSVCCNGLIAPFFFSFWFRRLFVMQLFFFPFVSIATPSPVPFWLLSRSCVMSCFPVSPGLTCTSPSVRTLQRARLRVKQIFFFLTFFL